jgi:hypothetical protein
MTRDEKINKMIETGVVTISNDPLVPSFGREATLNFFGWFPVDKAIKLDFTVRYVGEDVPNRLAPYSVTLIADTTPLPDGENEYQHFVNLAKEPRKIFDLIYDTTMLRDSQGKFNR